MDDMAAALYRGEPCDCALFYQHLDMPRAQQAVLYALEHLGVEPPLPALVFLWTKYGQANPYAFFVPAVFQHIDLWTNIIRDLVHVGQWEALNSYKATRPAAAAGHMRCGDLYITSEGRALASVYTTTWMLLRCVDDLLKLTDVDHLLERLVTFPEFAAAVQRSTSTSPVCLLARPVQDLTDDEFRGMVLLYMRDRERIGLGPCLHWHTEALRRGDPICATRWVVARDPADVHELLHGAAAGLEMPYVPHLWSKALREQPVACAKLGPDMAAALQLHSRRMDMHVQRAGRWVLPKDLVKAVARYL